MSDYVLGFDVGGTRLKSGALDRRGRLLAEGITPSEAHRGPEALLRRLAAETSRLSRAVGGAPRAIGVGFPGAVDPAKGVVLLPGRLAGLEGFPLVPRLAAMTGRRVVADNDARLAMVAEAAYGRARGKRWALTITLGTGVGSCPLLDGRILRDPHLQFGTQMSHIVMQSRDGRLCFTGARGTAEMLCSATALANQVVDGLSRGIPSLLSERWQDDPRSIDAEAVMEAVARKDRLACDELRVWTEHLGWFLVSAIHAYAPQVVILSGGGTHGARHYLPSLRRQVAAHLFRWPRRSRVPIVVSTMQDHAGVLGAGALAWEGLA
jgi:glucokinase